MAKHNETKIRKTKISNAGRGTYLVWEWENISIDGNYIVGKIRNNAGLHTSPRLYKTKVNANGDPYVTLEGIGRIYLNKPHLNLHKMR